MTCKSFHLCHSLNASASPIIVAINKIDLLKQAEAIGGHHQFMVGTEEERSRSRKSSDNHVIQSLEELRLTWNTLLPKAGIFIDKVLAFFSCKVLHASALSSRNF